MSTTTPALRCLLLSSALALAGCGSEEIAAPRRAPPAADDRPPVILISIDTLRSDRLPAYGYGDGQTPAIDALRRDAILFERAYTPVPLTMPAHASILTGRLPAAHGVRDNIGYRFDSAAVDYLPRLLKRHGYATGAAVSAFVLRGAGGFAAGFDFYDDAIEQRPRAGVGGLQRPGAETLLPAVEWLRQRGREPFFLFFHLFEPHTPYAPPEPYASRFTSPYDGEVAAADRVVGDLIDELVRLGIYDRAVVVLLSDHGEGLGEHGEDEHGILLYRESLQVPLLLKLPKSEHGGRSVAAPVQLLDVFPTLLALTGLAPPDGLPGTSLLEQLDGDPATRPLYSETYFPRLHFGWSELTSLIEGRFHFIDGPDPELYDLEADPRETRNLLRDERATAQRLRRTLAAYDRDLVTPAAADPEERRALEALGYVGTVGGVAAGPLPDPKSRLETVRDLKEGLRRYSSGDFEAAVSAYHRAVTANPRSLDAWEYLGRSLHELGRVDEALAAFHQALELADGRASHLAVAAALILLNGGRTAAALELLELETARSPQALELRLLESRAFLLAGRPDEALASAEAAVSSAPDNADAVYMRGAVRIGRRDLDEAQRDLRRALDLSPAHTAAMSDLAALLQHRGDVTGARRLLERVLELNPGDAMAAARLRKLPSVSR